MANIDAPVDPGTPRAQRRRKYEPASWRPTRKWWAALVTSLGALAVAWVEAGEWSKTLSVVAIGVVVQAVVTYLLPNVPSETGTGVPPRTP